MSKIKDPTFGGTWPYEPRWFETDAGRIHYIDEGDRAGRPIVMVHGNPTWGYLYRNFVDPMVAAGHRVIVPDHLGFGLSEKPSNPDVLHVPDHAARLDALLESLDLQGAVVVCQDWGGPISLHWATQHPERVAGLFILNTFAHAIDPATLPEGSNEVPLPLPLRLFRTPGVGEVMVKGLDMFKRAFLFRQGVTKPERLTSEIKRAYTSVHSGWSERTGILVFPRDIPVRPGGPVDQLNAATEAGLETHFRGKPAHICWAMKDPAFLPEYLDTLWLKTLPDAGVTRLPDAGHYLQEDAHELIVPELERFVAAL